MADSFTFFIFWAAEKYGAYVLVMTALNQITLIWEGSYTEEEEKAYKC